MLANYKTKVSKEISLTIYEIEKLHKLGYDITFKNAEPLINGNKIKLNAVNKRYVILNDDIIVIDDLLK